MKQGSNLHGALWNTVGSTMYGVNSFIMLALVSRVGTVEQSGYFGIAFTTAQILYIVGLFGVNIFQMTDYQHQYRFSDYAKVKVFSCFLMLVGCILAIFVIGDQAEKTAYLLTLTLLMLLNAVGELYQSLFFQNNRLDLSGSALFYRTFWSLAIFTAVLFLTKNILLSVILQTLCNFGVTFYYAVKVAPQFISLEAKQEQTQSKAFALVLECAPLFIGMFLMNLIINASKYGIEFFLDDTAQGYYNMIFMPAQVINLCSQFLFKPLLNRYAVLLAENQISDFRKLVLKQSGLIAVFTVFCCLGAYVLGAPVLGWLYKKDLSMLKYELALIVLGGGVFAACQLFYYILVILRQQKKILAIYTFLFLISTAVTALLVIKMQLMGAVLSFIVTHVILLVVYIAVVTFVLRRKNHA